MRPWMWGSSPAHVIGRRARASFIKRVCHRLQLLHPSPARVATPNRRVRLGHGRSRMLPGNHSRRSPVQRLRAPLDEVWRPPSAIVLHISRGHEGETGSIRAHDLQELSFESFHRVSASSMPQLCTRVDSKLRPPAFAIPGLFSSFQAHVPSDINRKKSLPCQIAGLSHVS